MTHSQRQLEDAFRPPGGQHHHVPPGTGTFGMGLFLLALAMLFGASMLLYVAFRLTSDGPPLGSIELPWGLWVSTALILISSYTMHRALQNVRHERQTGFRNALLITFLLAVAFLVVQIPSMMALYQEHEAARDVYNEQLAAHQDWQQAEHVAREAEAGLHATEGPGVPAMPLFGLIMFLILLHALHIVGGLPPLLVLTIKAHSGRYDHEHHSPVKYVAMYWHFLDVVWILMFVMFLLAA